MKVADIIISKLDGIHAKLDDLTSRVAKLEQENFLLEEYKPDVEMPLLKEQHQGKSGVAVIKPKGPFVPKKRKSRKETQLPPAIARDLMDDDKLAKGTKYSYANILEKILGEPKSFEAVIQMRNEGIRAKDVASHMLNLNANSVFTSHRVIENSITVARRYGLTELVNKQYVFTDKFHQNKRVYA